MFHIYCFVHFVSLLCFLLYLAQTGPNLGAARTARFARHRERDNAMVIAATPPTTDFVQPPDYEQTERWSDMIGKYGVLEPFDHLRNAQTRYGPKEAWDCTFWELVDDELIPHLGIRIFNKKICQALALAEKLDTGIAGEVIQDGTTIKIVPCNDKVTAFMGELFAKRNK